MGQADVVLAQVFVIAAHVVGEFGMAALTEEIGGTGPGRIGNIHKVGRAAHHAAGGARPAQHHRAPFFEVLAGARHDKGEPDPLAARRRDIGHRLAMFGAALHVVERGDRARPAREPRMRRDIAHPLAAEPNLALLLAQPRQILLPATRSHHATPTGRISLARLRPRPMQGQRVRAHRPGVRAYRQGARGCCRMKR